MTENRRPDMHDEPNEPETLLGEHFESVLREAFGDEPEREHPAEASRRAADADRDVRRESRARRPRIQGDPDSDDSASSRAPDASSSVAAFVRALQENRSNYEILDEIARGGMGVILRAHDRSLERDVAVKVLREDRTHDESVLRRFIEEAQIGGQLQHPGIVPVYEFGRMADQRPYFAMKLIRGRTLASLLADRRDPAQDAHRFLGIFEQVCQTIAYAHTRRVIHRDLKPSNVMVGAFGEVQIVDWGLAKPIVDGPEPAHSTSDPAETAVTTMRHSSGSSSSHSIQGSVMGTPAYMPPEQARGTVAEIDERSDVFALGAILCEILTGKPPYIGEPDDVRSDAALARTSGAFARLDASDTDPELRAICKHCLQAERDARPRDASALARAIADFLAALQQRAHAAEIAVAEARVKVEDERKARRLTLALALSILLTVVVGGAAGVWMQHQREARRSLTTERVNAALERATTAYGDAEATRDLAHWEQAVSAIDRAQALLDAGEPTPELSSRTHDLVSRVHSQAEIARRRTELEDSNHDLLAKLQEFHAPAGESNYPTDWSRTSDQFARAFREQGLDLDALSTAAAVDAIRARGIDAEIAAGLDEWAAARRNAGMKEAAHRLAELAILADPDVTRARLRSALARGDKSELVHFARTEDLAAYPAATLNLLTSALDNAGASPEALLVARVARRLKPDDFVSNVYLARLLTDHPAEAARYFEAALALRSNNLSVISDLGWILDHYLYDFDSAIALYRQAIAENPGVAPLRLYLGHAFRDAGELDLAIESYRQAIRLDPSQRSAHAHLGTCLLEKGDLVTAIRECREAIRLSPDYTLAYLRLGDALLANADPVGALAAYREARRVEPQNPDGIYGEYRSLVAGGEYERAFECARTAARGDAHMLLWFVDAGIEFAELVDVDGALTAAQSELTRTPKDPRSHLLVGLLLQAKGRYSEALFEIRTSHLLSNPNTTWFSITARQMERAAQLVEIERAFDRRMRENEGAFDARDALGSMSGFDLGRLALRRGLSVTAARMFEQALSSDAGRNSEIPIENRIDSVSAAISAGMGADDEALRLDAEQRAHYRSLAAAWMRADLELRAKQTAATDADVRAGAAQALAVWRESRGLSHVRGDEALARLNDSDRSVWRELWDEVAQLSERVRRDELDRPK